MQTERLATLDEHGARQFVVPAEVNGRFRKMRNRVYSVLLAIFLILPWLKMNGLQLVLIDIPHRHFEIFGGLFLAHDAPLLFLIFALCALTLVLATSVYGRIWCGWACPQTVFIDAVYRRIEIWVEGNYMERRKLRAAPLSAGKLRKLILKWGFFFLVSSVFAHSLIAYFTGSDRLLQMIQGRPGENWFYFLLVTSVSLFLTFNFGWFREQFCFIMCPYGRFQSVLMSAATVTVQYDEKRGEPRKGSLADSAKATGDCVSCNRCVQVCPTGIDIRKGVQLECIACTACIDACDEIMRKVHKPENLIGYRSMTGTKPRFARTRVIANIVLILICTMILGFALANRKPYSVNILRASDTPYQLVQEGIVLNHFKVHYMNQSREEEEFSIAVSESSAALGVKVTQSTPMTKIEVGESREVHFFVMFPKEMLNPKGEAQIELVINEAHSQKTMLSSVTVLGPAP